MADDTELDPADIKNISDDQGNDEDRMKRIEKKLDSVLKYRGDPEYIEQWRNRRRMAWTSLISILFVIGLALLYITPDRLKSAENILNWYFITCAGIVGAYMGTSVWAQMTRK